MTPYLVGGLVVGSVYALAALGLILTYTSSRVFNFAQGALAFFCALTFRELVVAHGWPAPAAALAVVGVLAPALGLGLWAVLFRHLTHAPPHVRLVSTVGLWVAVPPVARILYGHEEIYDRTGLGPQPPHVYRPLGVAIDSDQLIVLVATAAIAVALLMMMRVTPFGLAVRATVDAPVMASVAGIDTRVVGAVTWMIGTALAGASGVLLAPLRGYQETQFTFLLLGAFAAVVIARMHSLIAGVAGALLIGLAQNLAQSSPFERVLDTLVGQDSVLQRGLVPSIPFLLMLVFLITYRGLQRERFTTDTRTLPAPVVPGADDEAAPRSRWRRALPLLVGVAVILVLPEVLSGRWQAVVAKGLALSIALLSYVVLTGQGGMISLCQITFAGIGGAITAQLATNWGWPVLPSIVVAALVVVPVGLLAALPSLRLGDLYLALATLAFAEVVQNLFFQLERINNFDSGVRVPRPVFGPVSFGDDRAFYYLLVVAFLLIGLLVLNLQRSTTGMALDALRSSEAAAATIGVGIVRAKLAAFGVSAFIAALGGGFYVTYARIAQPGQAFNALLGAVWLAVVVTWGVRSVSGALAAGLALAVMPQLFSEHLSGGWLEVPTMLFGLGAIALAREPRGVLVQLAERRRGRRARRPAGAGAS
jgi:branched-chain amino acid transport system permease protein